MKYTSIHAFWVSACNLFEGTYIGYGVAILIMNIMIYIILTVAIFICVFIVDNRSFNFLNNFKLIQGVGGIFMVVVLCIASMAGIPPLLGFVGKFCLFIYLLNVESYFLFLIFLVLNFFALYFYIQNFRFMVSKTTNYSYSGFKFSFALNEWYIFFSVLLLVLNLFGFLFIEDIFLVVSYCLVSL